MSSLQVRRSFLQELEVHNNWSVVDMLFREFYTGSDKDLAPQERAALEKASKDIPTKHIQEAPHVVVCRLYGLCSTLNYLVVS